VREYLNRVTSGDIKRLMLFEPPRHGKSEMVTVRYPVWWLENDPSQRFIVGAYNQTLADEFSRKSRRIAGERIRLSRDRWAVSDWKTMHGGGLRAVGVGAGVTGHGANGIVIDDPVKNREEANSPAYRQRVWDWYKNDLYTRLEPDAFIILIMTRWHEDDLAGRILASDDAPEWTVVSLPAEAEAGDPLGRVPGEALCPERYPLLALQKIKVVLGRDYYALYQQRPQPDTGEVFRRAWWDAKNRYDAADRWVYNRNVARWLSFDTAYKDTEEMDYTAMAVLELTPEYEMVVREVWHERLEFPQLAQRIEDEGLRWNQDGKLREIVIEDKGAGTSAYQTLLQSGPREIRGRLHAFMPVGSKTVRARQASLWCERDCVKLPQVADAAPWLFEFSEELFKFPSAAHDDQVDALVQGILYLENILAEGWRARNPEVANASAE